MAEVEEKTPEPPPAEAPATETAPADSATFSRCAGCANSEEINPSTGTLVCKKHNMRIDAEADEIPDDCVEYHSRDAAPAPEPPAAKP